MPQGWVLTIMAAVVAAIDGAVRMLPLSINMKSEELEGSEDRRAWLTIAIAALVFVFGSGFVWTEFIDRPILEFKVLPSYAVAGQNFSGVDIENRGMETAHDILVKVSDLDSRIKNLELESDEAVTLKDGGEGADGAVVQVDRMTAGSSLTLYLITEESVGLGNHLSVTSEEVRGSARTTEAGLEEGKWYFLLGFMSAALLGYLIQRARLSLMRMALTNRQFALNDADSAEGESSSE